MKVMVEVKPSKAMKSASSPTRVPQLVTVLVRKGAAMNGQDAYWQYQQPPQPSGPLPFSTSPQTSAYTASQSPPTGAVPVIYTGDVSQPPYASTSSFVYDADPVVQPPPPASVPSSHSAAYAFLGQYDAGMDYSQQANYVYPAQPQVTPLQDDFRLGTAMSGEGVTVNGGGDHEERLSNARMSKKPKPRPPPPQGAIVTDKSCTRCRVRKGASCRPTLRNSSSRPFCTVRCNRIFPRCDHCTARDEDCDLKDWTPRPKYRPNDPARVAALEKRLGTPGPLAV